MKILWVKTGVLHPLDTGGKIRTYHMLRELKKSHEIIFLTLGSSPQDSRTEEKVYEYCNKIFLVPHRERCKFTAAFYADLARNLFFSHLPYAIEKYASPGMWRKITELVEVHIDLVVCDFLTPAVNFRGPVGVPTLLFQHNIESLIWERHTKEQSNLFARAYLTLQWRRMKDFEKRACASFDGVVTVSRDDEKALRARFRLGNILGFVPTGVDADYFSPQPTEVRKTGRLVFIGSMDWLPNEDAILWFVQEMYPRIKVAAPGVTLAIVGRNPSPKVVAFSREDSSIFVTGTVNDVRPHVATGSVIVVPLRIGGGTRIKIFEGMAMGIPVVSTRIGAEGLPVTDGETILLADTAEDFAKAVLRLLHDREFADRIQNNALGMVRAAYSWSAVTRVFEKFCRTVLHTRRRA